MTWVLSTLLVAIVGALGTAAYLWLFHDAVTTKEVLSTGVAIATGSVLGRLWERRALHG